MAAVTGEVSMLMVDAILLLVVCGLAVGRESECSVCVVCVCVEYVYIA